MQVTARVVDLSHYQYDTLNGKFDWNAVKKAGIWGVIYKATEGSTYVDDTYAAARKQIEGAGLLFGAYHFFRPGNISDQVENFLDNADPSDNTLLVLDHEDDGCSVDDVVEWLQKVEEKAGQRPALYSGHLIKDQLGDKKHSYLSTVRLWLCQYGSSPSWPANWDSMWLWQYTDGQAGPEPHSIPGIGHCDINSYGLSQEDLRKSWAPGMKPDLSMGLNQTEATWIQASLNLLGGDPQLVVDGLVGGQTQSALKNFQKKNSMPQTGAADKQTVDRMLEQLAYWNEERHYVQVA